MSITLAGAAAGSLVKKGASLVSELASPVPSYKFFVFIFDPKTKIPFLIDFLFEKVSGFGVSFDFSANDNASVSSEFNLIHPVKKFKTLTLERGRPVVTGQASGKFGMPVSLAGLLELQTNKMEFKKVNILLSVCKHWPIPCANWLFYDAVPSEWSMSSLDASSSNYLVETFTIQYSKYEVISL